MQNHTNIHEEIIRLKRELEATAQKHHYNFGHPSILEISRQLDTLIVKTMDKKK